MINKTNPSTTSSSHTWMTARTSDRTSNTQPIIYSSASKTSLPTLTDSNELSSYVGTVTDSWTELALDPELGFDNSISDNIAPNLDLDIPQTPWEHDNEHENLIIRGPTILLTTLKQKTVPTFLKRMGYSAPNPLSKNPVVRNFDLNINESKNDSPPWSPYTLSTRLLALERYIEDTPGTKLSTIYPLLKPGGAGRSGIGLYGALTGYFDSMGSVSGGSGWM
ncbi:hypothetical protein AFLA70_58g004121 [Aspergillus flavus AF70]|nr:hypothetical protein AFLA70_58g004121 [Aspergillus flavus AF70]